MVKVAMLSKWHVHAGGYAGMVKGSGKAEIAAVWDDDTARGEAWAKELGAAFYADLDELLARDDIDAVICDAPTTAHRDILVKAAKAGKHIFTEKALAPTVAECLDVKKAVEEAGVRGVRRVRSGANGGEDGRAGGWIEAGGAAHGVGARRGVYSARPSWPTTMPRGS